MTRPQFWFLGPETNSLDFSLGGDDLLFVSDLKNHYCGRVFFLDASYFCWRSQNFAVVWLWPTITPVENVIRSIRVPHFRNCQDVRFHMDLAWICASLGKFRKMSVLWKTLVFCIFSWPARKNFQVAANRTILKIDAFHIAHFEADVPNFPKHLWKLAIPRKLWVPAHSEVRWSGTMTAKMSVFWPLFGRKWFVSPNWPHEPPLVLYMVGKLQISFMRW